MKIIYQVRERNENMKGTKAVNNGESRNMVIQDARPLTAQTGVRFPLGVPFSENFLIFCHPLKRVGEISRIPVANICNWRQEDA